MEIFSASVGPHLDVRRLEQLSAAYVQTISMRRAWSRCAYLMFALACVLPLSQRGSAAAVEGDTSTRQNGGHRKVTTNDNCRQPINLQVLPHRLIVWRESFVRLCARLYAHRGGGGRILIRCSRYREIPYSHCGNSHLFRLRCHQHVRANGDKEWPPSPVFTEANKFVTRFVNRLHMKPADTSYRYFRRIGKSSPRLAIVCIKILMW